MKHTLTIVLTTLAVSVGAFAEDRLQHGGSPAPLRVLVRRYGELTGIKQPIKLEDAVTDQFLKAAHAKYPPA